MRASVLTILMTVAVVAMTLTPHHHHGARPCAVVQTCQADHAANDRHTAHHAAADHGCVLRQCVSADDTATGSHLAEPDAAGHPHGGHAAAMAAMLITLPACHGSAASRCAHHAGPPPSSPAHGRGLRAPPVVVATEA